MKQLEVIQYNPEIKSFDGPQVSLPDNTTPAVAIDFSGYDLAQQILDIRIPDSPGSLLNAIPGEQAEPIHEMMTGLFENVFGVRVVPLEARNWDPETAEFITSPGSILRLTRGRTMGVPYDEPGHVDVIKPNAIGPVWGVHIGLQNKAVAEFSSKSNRTPLKRVMKVLRVSSSDGPYTHKTISAPNRVLIFNRAGNGGTQATLHRFTTTGYESRIFATTQYGPASHWGDQT